MRARSLIVSLVRTPDARNGTSASRAPDGWQVALTLLGFTFSLHYRRYSL